MFRAAPFFTLTFKVENQKKGNGVNTNAEKLFFSKESTHSHYLTQIANTFRIICGCDVLYIEIKVAATETNFKVDFEPYSLDL